MVVYVELAFLENFCIDFLLLLLTAIAMKASPTLWRLLLSAAIGAAFAVLYPLLSLSSLLLNSLKFAVGALLPLPVVGRGKWGWGIVFFLLFTFLFGGALSAIPSVPPWVRFPLFLALAFLSAVLVARLYRRRARLQYIYDCVAFFGEKRVAVRGFLDSGNFASNRGIPVCFLAVELLYELVGEQMLFEGREGGQVCDEMQIFTQAGAKKIPLYLGEIEVEGSGEKKEVYFAPAANRIGREYKIVLHSRLGL